MWATLKNASPWRAGPAGDAGYLEAYQVLPGGVFRKLMPAETAVMAKTSVYSPQLDREFVSVPHLGDTLAKILVFAPRPSMR